jgi:hypothetical protein
VAAITPNILHGPLLAPIAAFWIVIVRVLFFATLYAAGLLPRAAGAPS